MKSWSELGDDCPVHPELMRLCRTCGDPVIECVVVCVDRQYQPTFASTGIRVSVSRAAAHQPGAHTNRRKRWKGQRFRLLV